MGDQDKKATFAADAAILRTGIGFQMKGSNLMVSSVKASKVLAQGSTVYGQRVTVSQLDYTEDTPGIKNRRGFAVAVAGTRDRPAHTAGFASMADVKRYLHSFNDETFSTVNAQGKEVKETRRGLGIPVGMVSELKDETAAK